MLLELLVESGLLKHSSSSNILKKLPLKAKDELLTTTFKELLDNKENSKEMISSMPHLLFFYELIGTSFALPLSHSLLTQRGLDVYKNWINEPEYRPAPVDEDFNTFLITILKHMSQFFENEPTTVIEQEDSRNSISVQILFFIRQIYTSYHSSFTPEVKDVLVKVMIGICKKYFQHTNLPELSNDFPAELELALYQLHECWMLTEEMNMELWEIIWRDYSSWTEHVETISQWYGLQQSLTDNVLSHVSNKDKTVEFELQWMPWHSEHVLDKFIMKLSTSFIDYAFIRFSRFLGNCITKSQKIALHATHAIKLLIETFYQYPPSVCDGNVVLKMYGDVLFQTMIINRDKYDDTTSMACETIMRVFVNFMNRTTFNKEWISNLYAGLISILDNPNSVSVTILSYPLLLDLPLPGIEVLLPHYIRYIHEIVFKVNPQQQLRGYIYQLLSKIIPRCTFFKHNPIPVITQPIYKDYLEIIKAIDEILSKQLRDENELQLIVDLFEVSRIQLCETQSLIFTNTVFGLLGRQFNQWINSNTLYKLPAIGRSFYNLYQTVASISQKDLKALIGFADSLMKCYCGLISEASFQISRTGSFVIDMNLLLRQIFGLIGYVPTSSFGNYSRVIDLLNILSNESSKEVSDSIKLLNKNIDMNKINTKLCSHSPISELSIGVSIPELLQFHSIFVSSETSLVTIIDLPAFFLQPELPLLMIVRTAYSQNVCGIQLIPPLVLSDIPQQRPTSGNPNDHKIYESAQYTFKGCKTLVGMLDANYSSKVQELLKALSNSTPSLLPFDPNDDIPVVDINRTTFPTPLSTYTVAKLCCSLNVFPNTTQLKQVPFSQDFISKTLVDIDRIATRPQYLVSIVAVDNSQIAENQRELEWFVQRLGWIVKVSDASYNLFPESIISLQKDIVALPMIASPTEQVIFCASSRIKKVETQKAILEKSDFVLLWGRNNGTTQKWAIDTVINKKPWIAVEPLSDGRFAVFNQSLLGSDYLVISAEGLIDFTMGTIRSSIHHSSTTFENYNNRQNIITKTYETASPLTAVNFVFDAETCKIPKVSGLSFGPSDFKHQNPLKSNCVMTCLSRSHETNN